MKHQENPSQQAWLIGGLVALVGVGAYFMLRDKPKAKSNGGDGQLGPPPQADELAYVQPNYTATFVPTQQLTTNFVITKKPYCFTLEDMWELSMSFPSYHITRTDHAEGSWGVPKSSNNVLYSSITCKFYTWAFGQWAENTEIQTKANTWASERGLS